MSILNKITNENLEDYYPIVTHKGVTWRPSVSYQSEYNWRLVHQLISPGYERTALLLSRYGRSIGPWEFTWESIDLHKNPLGDIPLHEAFTEVERLAIFAETGFHVPPVNLSYQEVLYRRVRYYTNHV